MSLVPSSLDRALIAIRRHLLPFLFLLYLVAYLDRVNISFAAPGSAEACSARLTITSSVSLLAPLPRLEGLGALERFDAEGLDSNVRLCATTLAKAHKQFGYIVTLLMGHRPVED